MPRKLIADSAPWFGRPGRGGGDEHGGILLPQLPAGPGNLNWGTVWGIVPAKEK
jgi:hypothetical protein